jgi:hypothetical protein
MTFVLTSASNALSKPKARRMRWLSGNALRTWSQTLRAGVTLRSLIPPNCADTTHSGRLVYFEEPFTIGGTLQRERQLKWWSRAKKLSLVQNQTAVLKRLSQSREVIGQTFQQSGP